MGTKQVNMLRSFQRVTNTVKIVQEGDVMEGSGEVPSDGWSGKPL